MADDELSEHVVRLREDAQGWRKADGPRLVPDDPFLTGLGEEEAENLVRANWALQRSSVEEAQEFYDTSADAEDGAESDESADGSSQETSNGDETESGAEDVGEWENWNEEAWLDLDYRQRAEDVQEGRVDGHLDKIEEAETSETVIKAVEERRAELNEEG